MKNEKVWCLFSIQNEYDQPDNNLEVVWLHKPTYEQLCKAMGFNLMAGEDDFVEMVLNGKEVRYEFADFRLREVECGKEICEVR